MVSSKAKEERISTISDPTRNTATRRLGRRKLKNWIYRHELLVLIRSGRVVNPDTLVRFEDSVDKW
jgi:hypothetical protein